MTPIGKKFWPLVTANYDPNVNVPVSFRGTVTSGSNIITNVYTDAVTAMTALTAANTAITGPGVTERNLVTGFPSATSVALTSNVTVDVTDNPGYFYYNRTKPALNIDEPIQAILCLDGSHGVLTFIDAKGNTITIPASTLLKGEVYYFEVRNVTAVTAGDFIGISFA